jgi:hypothetical protein
MTSPKAAIRSAIRDGYLVTGGGNKWLDCEVAWRRRCQACGEPTVVVTPRKKYADVYLMLRKVPHDDIATNDLDEMLDKIDEVSVSETQVNVLRGDRGTPTLFMGLSVSDLPIEQAMTLAPYLVAKAHELVGVPR